MIEIKDFTKKYKSHGNQNAFSVNNVSFKIEPGIITGLVGPNGSGKTTVIKAICGFHYPTQGQILFENQNQNENVMELCGYVPEISSLPPDIKAIDFLYYAAQNHKMCPQQASERIEELSKEFVMEEFLNKKIKILSKGQQQKVSFAQALIHNPPNLILDEPFSGLDPAQIIKFRNFIKDLGKTKSILISSHILSEVSNLCSQAFIMYQGNLYKVKDLKNIEQEFIEITQTEAEK